jgi:prenylcysteine oxidase / farnesylcysteine lyase
VIIAAPFHQTGITLHSDKLANDEKIIELIPPQPYVHLHVTLLSTTTKTPNPEYFSLGAEGKVPTTILTTYDAVRTRGGKEPEFNSLTYHGLVRQPEEGEEPEYLVKVFSKERVSDQWLSNIFSGKVGWVYRKEVCVGRGGGSILDTPDDTDGHLFSSSMLTQNCPQLRSSRPSSWTKASTT